MMNLRVALTLRESTPEEGAGTRRIRGYFRFLDAVDMPVGPKMMTEPYDWPRWSQWISKDVEEQRRAGIEGMLHPSATVELGIIQVRLPNLTPFYIANKDGEHD